MEFTKYHKLGAYHWKMYDDKNTKYSRHADRVKEWVKESSVLDIGCGDGKITSMLNATGIDNEPEAIRLAKEKGVNAEVGDSYNLPFTDESFESVFLGDVLEHMKYPASSLNEAHRVTSKYLYISNPIKGMDNDPFHYQEWTPDELIKLVESCGFKLEGEVLTVVKDKRDYLKFKKLWN